MARYLLGRARFSAAAGGSPCRNFSVPSFWLLLRRSFSDAAAEECCGLLRRPPNPATPNLEMALKKLALAGKLDASTVESVLRRYPASTAGDRSTLLRFFVWAGLQPGYRHSAAAYSAACDALQLSRRPETVNLLLDAYQSDAVPVSVRTFKVLLILCRQAGSGEQALQVLRRMAEFGCRPDTSSFNSVIRLLLVSGGGGGGEGEKKKIEVAEELLEEMTVAGVQPDMVTCVSMVKALCGAGRLDEARGLVGRMKSRGCLPNVVVYTALLDGACNSGDLPAAMELLEEMESGAAGESCKPNVVTYTCLMKCLCEMGRAEEAICFLDRMGKHGAAANRAAVATLLGGLCRQGTAAAAAEAFAVAERVVRDGVVTSEEAYSSLLLCFLREGKVAAAEELAEKMLDSGVNPDGAARNLMLREICAARRPLDGLLWVNAMWAKGLTLDADVYSSLLDVAFEEGHLREAVGMVNGMVQRGILLRAGSPACAEALAEILEASGEVDLAGRPVVSPVKS
ncbi:unnamed protein product [Spirodela intermedia]|uniref:Uncharacterized protein n=1 Tax=Spirodela intermedia TaxID=51605 RepID=A0A7I8LMA2_SPIIN|nr:unnamed protein product [Spirodela intermedia]